MRTIQVVNGSQFKNKSMVAVFGAVRTAEKSERVTREECAAVEEFATWGGTTTAKPGDHYILTPVGGGKRRPCAIAVFDDQYQPAENSGEYKAKGEKRIVQVPKGIKVVLTTIEPSKEDPDLLATQEVEYPHFVAIGGNNEVYSNKSDFVSGQLSPTDGLGNLVN